MKYTIVHASGRVSFRRVYPVDLRPFIPARPQELKVSLGRQGDVGLGTRHDAAMRQYDAIVAKARAKQSGHLNILTSADVTYLADRFVVDRLQEDEEGRWDQEGRDLYIAVTKQLQAAGVAFTSPWSDRPALRWSEKAREEAEGSLRGCRALKAAGDLDGIIALWRDEAIEMARDAGFALDDDNRPALATLCRAINDAAIRSNEARLRRLDGDDVPTPLMPEQDEKKAATSATTVGILRTFDSYAAAQGISAGVKREWRSAIERLIAFIGHDSLPKLTSKHLRDWRDALMLETTTKGTLRTARTVRNKYLTPIKATLTWAVEEQLIEQNVATGVVVRVAKSVKLREKSYTDEEASKILQAALVPSGPRVSYQAAFARRWVPWLCAYTGARVNEITQLRKEDARREEGVWIIRITPEAGSVKTKEARLAPIHPHLIEQGFIDEVARSADGPLFYDAAKRSDATTESRQNKKIAERLALWVRKEVGITDPNVRPSHAWRDTFKTRALDAGIQTRITDAIQGHAPASVGESYGHVSVKALAAAIQRFPRFLT